MCRNVGKELVILFQRTAAAPWGHVASIIKRSSTGDSLSFGSTTNTVCRGPFRSSPWRYTYLVPSTTGTQERRTHVLSLKEQDTQLCSSRHFICKPTLLSQTLSNLLYLQIPLPSTLQPSHNKPNHILHLELFLELSFVNSSNLLFIPLGVKPCLLLLLLYINFVACISRASLSSKAITISTLLFKYGLFFYKT